MCTVKSIMVIHRIIQSVTKYYCKHGNDNMKYASSEYEGKYFEFGSCLGFKTS